MRRASGWRIPKGPRSTRTRRTWSQKRPNSRDAATCASTCAGTDRSVGLRTRRPARASDVPGRSVGPGRRTYPTASSGPGVNVTVGPDSAHRVHRASDVTGRSGRSGLRTQSTPGFGRTRPLGRDSTHKVDRASDVPGRSGRDSARKVRASRRQHLTRPARALDVDDALVEALQSHEKRLGDRAPRGRVQPEPAAEAAVDRGGFLRRDAPQAVRDELGEVEARALHLPQPAVAAVHVVALPRHRDGLDQIRRLRFRQHVPLRLVVPSEIRDGHEAVLILVQQPEHGKQDVPLESRQHVRQVVRLRDDGVQRRHLAVAVRMRRERRPRLRRRRRGRVPRPRREAARGVRRTRAALRQDRF